MGHQKTTQGQSNIQPKIDKTRSAVARQYMELIISLDEKRPQQWPTIIAMAREAGLSKETLCRELSCSWSTILRWEAGDTLPGPFARRAIKAKLLEMIDSQAKKGEPPSPVAADPDPSPTPTQPAPDTSREPSNDDWRS